ncbi:MAG: outer membrane protein assembly factor, partial [Phenylobacterium sp.]|nr:outer membrane protein assembly factor [Phenylobacterium sp.]
MPPLHQAAGARTEESGLGRLLTAVAASAAICAPAAMARAEPKAQVQGEVDGDLRATIQAVIGETEKPIENRFEARRRAQTAAEDAIAVLRSEGYYANVVEPDVTEGEPPHPVVKVTPGPRFSLAGAAIAWQGTPPGERAQT